MSKEKAKKLILVDDDDAFRLRLARAVKERGFDVYEAADSRKALLILNEQHPDYAILDLRIKEESGLKLLKELLLIKPDLKVVVLTGYGTISTTVDALKLGAVNYLTKPVDPDTILAAFEVAPKDTSPNLEIPHLEQVEWDHINRVVSDNAGNISKASKALGLHRRSLQRKLNKAPLRIK